ncbi:hypothetical protein DFH09DRAFT_1094605 [Mycena vulgaris]|nr:hypothetical protein DFH09DRAFT_1094605 [Mycena vulgaris]
MYVWWWYASLSLALPRPTLLNSIVPLRATLSIPRHWGRRSGRRLAHEYHGERLRVLVSRLPTSAPAALASRRWIEAEAEVEGKVQRTLERDKRGRDLGEHRRRYTKIKDWTMKHRADKPTTSWGLADVRWYG